MRRTTYLAIAIAAVLFYGCRPASPEKKAPLPSEPVAKSRAHDGGSPVKEIALGPEHSFLNRELPNNVDREVIEVEQEMLNEACGDSWCEGSFEYSFEHLSCSTQHQLCQFDVVMYAEGEASATFEQANVQASGVAGSIVTRTSKKQCRPLPRIQFEPCLIFEARCVLATSVDRGAVVGLAHHADKCLRLLESEIASP